MNESPPAASSTGISVSATERKGPISLLKADVRKLTPQPLNSEPIKLNFIPTSSPPQVIIQFSQNQQGFIMVAPPKQEPKTLCIKPKPPAELPQDIKHLKSPQALEVLFKKAFHLYKCMGYKCGYATISAEPFCEHFDEHLAESTQEIGFKRCACCYDVFQTGKELANHILNTHSFCPYLCGYCFYRALDRRCMTIHQV